MELKLTEEQSADQPQHVNSARFESLIRDHGGRMLAVARRYLHSEADAQDCVQDAYIQAFKNLNQFQERSSIETWLHRIVVNAALMKLRSTRRRREEFIEDNAILFDAQGKRIETEAEITLSVEQMLEDEESRLVIRQHIEQLPETTRNLLLLRDIEGYSTNETAELLGMTTGNVKTGLHRARHSLKKLMQTAAETNESLQSE